MGSDSVTAASAHRIAKHLCVNYGVEVTRLHQLDAGTFRVDLAEGRCWVARLFPAKRPPEWSQGDAAILEALAELEYPAERVANSEPLSTVDGQALLITEFIPAVSLAGRRDAIRAAGGLTALGSLLGWLHSLPGDIPALSRPGGAWHHLADGPPANELLALRELVIEGEQRAATCADDFRQLLQGIDEVDCGDGLPESFVHPDFVLANVVARPNGGMFLVDWTGAGRAARMWSLAFLLWSVAANGDLSRVDRTVAGYSQHIRPTGEELERLEFLIPGRASVFAAWAASERRISFQEAISRSSAARRAAPAIADRARAAFAIGDN